MSAFLKPTYARTRRTEKFFLVHLRLAPLTDEEITSVAKQYVDHMRPVEVIKDQSTDESADVGRAAAWEPSDTKADDRDDHIEWEPLSNSILQPEEADTILEAVRKHFDGKEREDVGPRTIRCLLFRYQLARDILKKLGETPNPEKLADTVVSHYAGIFDEKSTGDLIQSVVQQVSYTRAGQVKKSFWPEGLHS